MVMHFNVLSFIAASYQLFGRDGGKYLLALESCNGVVAAVVAMGDKKNASLPAERLPPRVNPRIYNIATRQAVTFAPNQNSQPEAGSGIWVKTSKKKHKTSSEGETTMKLEDRGKVKCIKKKNFIGIIRRRKIHLSKYLLVTNGEDRKFLRFYEMNCIPPSPKKFLSTNCGKKE